MISFRRPPAILLLALLALASMVLLLSGADEGQAKKKKKVFKNGTYTGTTSQGEQIQLDIKKKEATLVFVDVNPPCDKPPAGAPHFKPSFAGLTGEIKVKEVGKIAFGRGRKKVGSFDAEFPGDRGILIGYVKGKKAEGFAGDEYPGCPYDFDWEAERTGPNFF
jgi:hypothetical protein